tara:strand:- start:443 stop:1489 length:1047 start_codon:yes stop_codon:yes gene_type:complete
MNKFWPTSDIALNNRRLCKPWLIGVLCGLVAPLTTLIYAIRQKSLAVCCIPLLTVFTVETLILPVDRTSSQKYIYQIICGLAAYFIAKRQKIEARTDINLRSIASYDDSPTDSGGNFESIGGMILGVTLLRPFFKSNLIELQLGWAPASVPSIIVGITFLYISRWYFWDVITDNIVSNPKVKSSKRDSTLSEEKTNDYKVNADYTQENILSNKNTLQYPKVKSEDFKNYESKPKSKTSTNEKIKKSIEDSKKLLNQISEPRAIKESRQSDWVSLLTKDQKNFFEKVGSKANETLDNFLKRYFEAKQEASNKTNNDNLQKSLKEYKNLFTEGLITEDEYNALRKKILGL